MAHIPNKEVFRGFKKSVKGNSKLRNPNARGNMPGLLGSTLEHQLFSGVGDFLPPFYRPVSPLV
jgi:hypothetical protein